MEWRDPLGEYEFTCDGCHRGEYPEDYAADATPADAVPPTGGDPSPGDAQGGAEVADAADVAVLRRSVCNTKDNRLCVLVEYNYPSPLYSTFKIPDGLDLEDASVVELWYVKYDTLHITYKDGREEEINPHMSATEWCFQFKRGVTSIVSVDDPAIDHDIEYSEDDDE